MLTRRMPGAYGSSTTVPSLRVSTSWLSAARAQAAPSETAATPSVQMRYFRVTHGPLMISAADVTVPAAGSLEDGSRERGPHTMQRHGLFGRRSKHRCHGQAVSQL